MFIELDRNELYTLILAVHSGRKIVHEFIDAEVKNPGEGSVKLVSDYCDIEQDLIRIDRKLMDALEKNRE